MTRINRFTASVSRGGAVETVHVKNTGRCRELLLPGVTVSLAESGNAARKTRFDLVAVEKKRGNRAPLLINMDSQSPNAAAAEWLPESGLFSRSALIRREVVFGDSRLDFHIEDGSRRCFLEVKGVTLEENGVARFPDAPTERGVKHLRELIRCRRSGWEAMILFVIQMGEMKLFRPADDLHPAFGRTLREAAAAGVRILAMDCMVTRDSMRIAAPVAVDLSPAEEAAAV